MDLEGIRAHVDGRSVAHGEQNAHLGGGVVFAHGGLVGLVGHGVVSAGAGSVGAGRGLVPFSMPGETGGDRVVALAGGGIGRGFRPLTYGVSAGGAGHRIPVRGMAEQAGGEGIPAFGVGSALSRDFTATGRDTKGRGKRTAEGLQIMARLWSEDNVNFDGEYYRLEDATIAPKPVQSPMPLWVGGSAAAAIERTAQWGTGWQAGIENAAQIAPVITAIKQRTEELGRKIDDDHFGAGFGFRFGSVDDPVVQRHHAVLEKRLGKQPEGYSAVGGVDEMMALVEDFHRAGAHKFILRPIAMGVTDMMEQTQLMVEQLVPAISAMNSS